MPAYDYVCPDCNQEFTVNKPFAAAGEAECCPACPEVYGRRLYRSPRIVSFQGGEETEETQPDVLKNRRWKHGAFCPCCTFR